MKKKIGKISSVILCLIMVASVFVVAVPIDMNVSAEPLGGVSRITTDPSNDGADIHFKAQSTNEQLIQGSFSYIVS